MYVWVWMMLRVIGCTWKQLVKVFWVAAAVLWDGKAHGINLPASRKDQALWNTDRAAHANLFEPKVCERHSSLDGREHGELEFDGKARRQLVAEEVSHSHHLPLMRRHELQQVQQRGNLCREL